MNEVIIPTKLSLPDGNRPDKKKIPYVLRLLRDNLLRERKSLDSFQEQLLSDDYFAKRQAEGSISSCESRIKQLEDTLVFLNIGPNLDSKSDEKGAE